jgi:hypothetical protein
MIAGSDIVNGSASWLTEIASFSLSCIRIARRVGSDRALKVRSSG